MPEEQVGVTPDDIQTKIDAAIGPIQADLEKMQRQATGDPDLPAWETNPNWSAPSWDKAIPEVEKALKAKGYSPVDTKTIVAQVREEIAKEEHERVERANQAKSSLDEEISTVKEAWQKETEAEFTKEMEQTVYDFVAEWNPNHPQSKITSFKDAVEIMKEMGKLTATKKEEGKPEEKPRMERTPVETPQGQGRRMTPEEALALAREELA